MGLLYIMFFGGIAFAFFANYLYNNKIDDYKHTHEEYQTYAPVSTVAYDDESQLVYVFYADAGALNVYSIDGTFRWSLSIPNGKNDIGKFYLEDDRLYLMWYDTYIYNAKTGEFIETHECTDAELDNIYKFEENNSLEGTGLDFDLTDVYTVDKDGSPVHYIVDRPWYYALINPFVGFLISVSSVLIMSAIFIISIFKR